MLNRLFIAIGVLVILAIGAAFIVPRFIQWGDYRGRLEMLASDAAGAPVRIKGDISFSLLPQPVLQFADVQIGDEASPLIRVGRVEASFSLVDFLRDQYRVTQLELEAPELDVTIGKDGQIASGLGLVDVAAASNISIAEADIRDGVLRVRDQRSGQLQEIGAIGGEVRLDSLRGPLSFQGTGSFDGKPFGLRVSSGKTDSLGSTPLSIYVRAGDESFTLTADGGVTTAEGPQFSGTVSYRQPPPKPAEGIAVDAGRGDLVLDGKFSADAGRVVLTEYTLSPDENRPGTRLTGAAEVTLGAQAQFNIVASSGVISLPPRDATAELTDPPYELIRLLGELPDPPVPSMPGKLSMDIAELNLRGVSLRNVRVDADADGRSWQIAQASGTLPGETTVKLSGALSAEGGKPTFAGEFSVRSLRLDALAATWRRPGGSSPLFSLSGALEGSLSLSGDTLKMDAAQIVVGDLSETIGLDIGLAPTTRHLTVDAQFDSLTDEQGQVLLALLPDPAGSGSFAATFPKADVSLGLKQGSIGGLEVTDGALDANWEGGVLDVTRLSAADLGGAALDVTLTAFGTLAKPELSGHGTLSVADANAAALRAVFTALGTPEAVQEALRRQVPANLDLQLDAPTGEGKQALVASGTLGAADLAFDVKLEAGVLNALNAPLAGTLALNSTSPGALTAQLGLGDAPLFPEDAPLQFTASLEGSPTNSVEANLRLEGGGDHLSFAGNIVATDPTHLVGKGAVEAELGAPSGLLAALGAQGIYMPALSGSATLDFSGDESLKLTGITGEAGTTALTGDLALSRDERAASVSGAIALAEFDARSFLALFSGDASDGLGVWPPQDLAIGKTPRTTTGRITFTAPSIVADGKPFLTNGIFDFDWDPQSLRLRGLEADAGDGHVTFDAAICCSSPLADKRLTGRLTVSGVDVDDIFPPAVSEVLDGTLDASAQFDGTGRTLPAIMAAMTGSGSYSVRDFSAAHLDPDTFAVAGGIENVVDLEPAALVTQLTDAVAAGPFTSAAFTGSFTIAGGVLRNPNLAIDGPAARLFGTGSVKLADLTLAGRYTMTPVAIVAAASGIDASTAEIGIEIAGPVWAPEVTLDVSTLADGMKIKASEIELARLEKLRAEEEERQRIAAEERARVLAEQEAAAAAAAAAAEAERKAAEEEAARQAAEQASSTPLPPLDLGI